MKRIFIKREDIVPPSVEKPVYERKDGKEFDKLCVVVKWGKDVSSIKSFEPVEIENVSGLFYIGNMWELECGDRMFDYNDDSVEYEYEIVGRIKYSNEAIYKIWRRNENTVQDKV